jgi:hypothetical protein
MRLSKRPQENIRKLKMPIEQNVTVLKLTYRSSQGIIKGKMENTSYSQKTFKALACGFYQARDICFEEWFKFNFPNYDLSETDINNRLNTVSGALDLLGYHVEIPYGANVIVVIKKGAI